jgi:hypothetical protein
MKTKILLRFAAVVLLAVLSLLRVAPARAGTTIDPVHRYAYGANIGWLDWYADDANGAVVNDYYCSGYIWAANVGWINLGNGSPASGIQYGNLSASDFGVNNDGLGNLSGFAWGANIGWVNFEPTGAPHINIKNGKISGYVWSANCGWISLSNAVTYVQTDHILPGPLAANGLPIPWLLANFGTTIVDPNADPTGKGNTIAADYAAGTDPNNVNDRFRITAESFGILGTTATVTWASKLTRCYYIQQTPSLNPLFVWADSGLGILGPDGLSTMRTFGEAPASMHYYRVEAVRPLP